METLFSQTIPRAVADQSLWAYVLVYAGGLLTSFSPCILSMLPVMVGYAGGYSRSSGIKGFALSLSFVTGMSITFALLGLVAARAGTTFGQVGAGWYYLMAVVAISMGLHLLGVWRFNWPGLKKMPVRAGGFPGSLLAGTFFGLVASPCATPVLAVLVTYAAYQGDPAYGASLLFVYGLGHGLPLLVAGTFTAAAKGLPRWQMFTRFIPTASGGLLVLVGLSLLAWVHW